MLLHNTWNHRFLSEVGCAIVAAGLLDGRTVDPLTVLNKPVECARAKQAASQSSRYSHLGAFW